MNGTGGSPRWTTPASILVGAGVIAIAIYFGLRQSPGSDLAGSTSGRAKESTKTDAERTGSPSSGSSPNGQVQTKTTVVGTTATSTSSSAASKPEAGIDPDVGQALSALRDRIKRECYLPFKDDPEMPKRLKFIYSGSFDAQGIEVGRAISDSREGYFEPSSLCVRKLPMNMTIPASGALKNVQQPIEVP